VLDEEEFAALDLTEGDRKRGETAVKQILSLATKKELPT
jgi:hypothetical protein